jgi:hypothetical protein
MNAKNLLKQTQATNRATGQSRLNFQLRQADSSHASRTGYDSASGSFTVSPLSGGLQPVQSLTTAAFPVGRIVTVGRDRRIDGVPA